MSFGGSPKMGPRPAPPPTTPTRADATTFVAGADISKPLVTEQSLISTGPQGLQRKAPVQKRSLIGG